MFAGTAIFGSSFLAAMRWMFGVWLPSAHQVHAGGRRQWALRTSAYYVRQTSWCKHEERVVG